MTLRLVKAEERYKEAFSVLHTSVRAEEVPIMETGKTVKYEGKKRISKAVVIALAAALLLALTTAGYATDLGGIRRTVQVWFNGDQTDAVLEIVDGSYTLYYEDAEGQTHERQGGGVAYDFFGGERPLTEDEILEQINSPFVDVRDDGSVWVSYKDQLLDVTDKLDDNGVCYVQLKDGKNTIYMTLKVYDDGSCGYSTDLHKFPNAKGLD